MIDIDSLHVQNWTNTVGEWVEKYTIPDHRNLFPKMTGFYTAFMAQAVWHIPTCLRYFNPQLLKDGRIIASIVEEEGTPGEPGWVWKFFVTEEVLGDVEWRVETRGCAAV